MASGRGPDPVPDNYGRIARTYDRLMEPVNRPLHQLTVTLARPEPTSRILDVGCGTGHLLGAFSDATDGTAELHGLDLSPAMLDAATARLGSDVGLTVGDATDMPYDDGRFDIVACSLMLHELDMDIALQILTEAERVAAPGGTIVLTDYFTGSLRFKGRLWRAFSYGAEFLAGTDHFGAWRRHMRAGGIQELIPNEWAVDTRKVVAGGNLAIWVCSPGKS